jgi:hypothetical protein
MKSEDEEGGIRLLCPLLLFEPRSKKD